MGGRAALPKRDCRRAAGVALAAAVAWLAGPGPADAHDAPVPLDRSGLAVPAINHGAMAVFDRFRDPILATARSVPDPGPDLSALLLFEARQRAECLWLLVPGSVTDEANPLNLCAHAETAALKAILERLRGRSDPAGASARTLVSAIDGEMVVAGTSYALCVHSGDAFNTASPVRPALADLAGYAAARHPWTIALVAAALAGPLLLRRRVRRA